MSDSSVTKALVVVLRALGLSSLRQAPRDAYLLFLERAIRAYAYGSSTLVLTLLFQVLAFSDAQMGAFMTLTMLGDVGISLALTLVADRLGRRRVLALGAGLMLGSGIVFALASNYYILLIAAIIGVISPSGNEIGPFKAIEDSILAQLTSPESRAEIFAVLGLIGSCSTAVGMITIGWFSDGMQARGWTVLATYRAIFVIYAGCAIVKLGINFFLSENCEVESTDYAAISQEEREMLSPTDAEGLEVDDTAQKPPIVEPSSPTILTRIRNLVPPLSRESQSTLWKLCLLYALDNMGSGLTALSFVIYFYHQKFGLEPGTLGPIFFACSLIAGLSNLVAASVSRTLGLVKTMVFTHLPASLLLAFIPIPSTVGPAVALLVTRYCTATMDQALSSSFLTQMVLKEERTSVMGIVNVVQTLSRSLGPSITGALSERGIFWVSFVCAGLMKASYDLGLLAMFWSAKAREVEKQDGTA